MPGSAHTFPCKSATCIVRSAIPLNEAMLLGHDEVPGGGELDRYANEGARVFLAAYGVRPRRRG
jgi:hypothetical protein